MKNLLIALIMMIVATASAMAQNINWRSLQPEQTNIVRLDAGYDYSASIQLGYSRLFDMGVPVLLGLDYSMPMGNEVLDDFKVRLGAQVEVLQFEGLSATLKILSNFRRFENEMVRIVGFGSEFAAVVGYYHPQWYAAGEIGFDKAVATNLRNSDIMRSYFPGIRDGWYVPTGGHWYYGIQAGKTLGEDFDLTLRLGYTNAQHEDENAAIPFYAQLGMGIRF